MRKRIYTEFPLFTAYQVWVLIIALCLTVAAARLRFEVYNKAFFVSSVVDAVFLFVTLVELSMSVLKPVKAMLPRWTILVVAALLGVLALGVWRIASPPGATKLSAMSQYIIRIDMTTSVLRIVFFISLAALSQLLCLGWRDRVVQISTGLGFFSLVSLGVTFLHMNQGVGAGHLNEIYHVLDRLVVCAYIGSMLYWVVCLGRQVRERQEFTPQMQRFIEALAQNARSAQQAMRSAEAENGESY